MPTPTIWKWNGSIAVGATGQGVFFGSGSPSGVVSANPGSMYLRSDGDIDTTIYLKESGTGSSGWSVFAAGGGGGGGGTNNGFYPNGVNIISGTATYTLQESDNGKLLVFEGDGVDEITFTIDSAFDDTFRVGIFNNSGFSLHTVSSTINIDDGTGTDFIGATPTYTGYRLTSTGTEYYTDGEPGSEFTGGGGGGLTLQINGTNLADQSLLNFVPTSGIRMTDGGSGVLNAIGAEIFAMTTSVGYGTDGSNGNPTLTFTAHSTLNPYGSQVEIAASDTGVVQFNFPMVQFNGKYPNGIGDNKIVSFQVDVTSGYQDITLSSGDQFTDVGRYTIVGLTTAIIGSTDVPGTFPWSSSNVSASVFRLFQCKAEVAEVAISGNVLTLTYQDIGVSGATAPQFAVGQTMLILVGTATFLNTTPITITAVDHTAQTITASFTHADYSAADTGSVWASFNCTVNGLAIGVFVIDE